MNAEDFVTTRQAAVILGCEPSHIHWLVRLQVLPQIELSQRKRYYRRSAVERIARERAAKFEKAA